MKKQWESVKWRESDIVHVLPINDLKPHNEHGIECECNPTFDEDAGIVVHNSWDRREVFEKLPLQ